jgi:hypothetical protein
MSLVVVQHGRTPSSELGLSSIPILGRLAGLATEQGKVPRGEALKLY